MAVVEELFSDIKRRIESESMEKGVEKGIEKNVIAVVINCHKNDLGISMIANITQLSQERVIEILKENGLN